MSGDPPVVLTLQAGALVRGSQTYPLRRKTIAVLRYLLAHPGQCVSAAELRAALWPGVVVSGGVLRNCIRELRIALADERGAPRFLETLPRKGYRWIGDLISCQPSLLSPPSPPPLRSQLATGNWRLPTPLVGREAELTQLQQWLEKATTGQRQLVFLAGEPGIGKTTLVEAFVTRLRDQGTGVEEPKSTPLAPPIPDPRCSIPLPGIARGQCIEHYGPGEAYLPVLEALERLCQQPGQERCLPLLRQYAPMWLAQLPTLLTAEERASVQREIAGSTRERMLRELAVWLEAVTRETTLVLVLEDLHWSDLSTLDLLALLARRREPARLLVVGTYRSSEVHTHTHPLSAVLQELQAHALCRELKVEGLREAAVAQYVEHRFPVRAFPTRLAHVLHQRTEGNPLFLVNLLEDLVQQGRLTDGAGGWTFHGTLDALVHHVPAGNRQLITKLLEQVGRRMRRVLAAGSVAGLRFSSAAIAAALETTASEVERQCEEAVRRQLFIERAGKTVWPDGTAAARYGFRHALYHQVWHEQVSVSQQQEWHQRIGVRKEQAYGAHTPEIAAELAVHFTQGRDWERAVHYLQQAATTALQRCAYPEAVAYLTQGLQLLRHLQRTAERLGQELRLQTSLGMALMASKGYAAPEAKRAYDRAYALCQQGGEGPHLFPVLRGLVAFYSVRADHQTTRALATRCLTLAQREHDPVQLLGAHFGLGAALFALGDFGQARTHFEQGVIRSDLQQPSASIVLYGYHVGVACLARLATVLWVLGYPEQARQKSHQALALAREQHHPYSLAYALSFATECARLRRDVEATREHAEAALQVSTAQGLPLFAAGARILRGWALAEQGQGEEGIGQLQHGMAAWQATGAVIAMPAWLAHLAEAYGQGGQIEQGLALLTTALATVQQTQESWWEAELYRLTGELTRQKGQGVGRTALVPPPKSPPPHGHGEAEAEASFLKAIAIARRQHAKSLELRAVTSLSRLWQQQNRQHEAQSMLSDIYNWFTEGFDTKDLQEAKALLATLPRPLAIHPL